jgi:hypothetical protein
MNNLLKFRRYSKRSIAKTCSDQTYCIDCHVHANLHRAKAIRNKIEQVRNAASEQHATMSASIPQRCARQLFREISQRSSVPVFLAPAFSPRAFSTTSPAQSRVGGAAISIPPEVSFKLVDLPKSLIRTRGKDVPKYAAQIKGPRGMCCSPNESSRVDAN